MRKKKGEAGYLRARKGTLLVFVAVGFGAAAALVYLGWRATGSRLNLLTLAAALGCLPVCRALVNLIMLVPYQSIHEAQEREISSASGHLTVLYDLVVTSEKRAMPIQALVISNQTVCGYTEQKQMDTRYASQHIQNMLKKSKLEKITVKIFTDYKAFLARAEGMDNIASVEKLKSRRTEQDISRVLLEISL